MLSWASRFNICCFLDNHGYDLSGHKVECLLAAGARDQVRAQAGNGLQQLQELISRYSGESRDWLFGHAGYGMIKETIAGTLAAKTDPTGFPDLYFFVPEILIELSPGTIRIGLWKEDSDSGLEPFLDILQQVQACPVEDHFCHQPLLDDKLVLEARLSRAEYIRTIERLRQHILRGDCYEINFCQEFFARNIALDPIRAFAALSEASPSPFGAFYRVGEQFLLCASPERYIQKTGSTIISQPIKGTSPRRMDERASAEESDRIARESLYRSAKDRAENVMVVDLVRNDLSRICKEGSVEVTELFGIYTFPHVHQMISTVRGELPEGSGLVECLRATFPMGSMTGAPKHRVTGLIDEYEVSARGLYSGTLGYITPEGDFDFNVVIRSMLYNRQTGYLSYHVGSGITWYSDPQAEYEECLWKAEGMRRALAASHCV